MRMISQPFRSCRGRRPAGRHLLGGHCGGAFIFGQHLDRAREGALFRRPTTAAPAGATLWALGELLSAEQDVYPVLLTTQDLEEADILSDSVVVIDHGQAAPAAPPRTSSAGWVAATAR